MRAVTRDCQWFFSCGFPAVFGVPPPGSAACTWFLPLCPFSCALLHFPLNSPPSTSAASQDPRMLLDPCGLSR